MLLTFLHQVTIGSKETRELIRQVRKENSAIADSTASLGEFIEILLSPALGLLARSLPTTIFLIVDGLNECPDDCIPGILRLLQYLGTLGHEENGDIGMPIVKILLTSRETAEISSELSIATKAAIYGKNVSTIALYVEQILESRADIAEKFKSAGINAVSYFQEHSRGTFLWVSSVLECVKWTSGKDLKQMLESASPQVEAIYLETLNRMLVKTRNFEIDRILEILRWVAVAIQDLTMIELRIGIALMRNPHADLINLPSYTEFENGLIRCGAFLQVVSDSTGIIDRNTISVAHETFKVFITDKDSAPTRFYVDPSRTSAVLASACLAYISQMPSIEPPQKFLVTSRVNESLRVSHPFFVHATFWGIYLQRSRVSKDTPEYHQMMACLRDFLNLESLKKWISGMLVYANAWGTLWKISQQVFSGIEDLVVWLDENGILLKRSSPAGQDTTCIFEEATGDHKDSNKSYLCDLGARAAAEVWLAGNPKYMASSCSSFRLARELNAKARNADQESNDIRDILKLSSVQQDTKPIWWEANLGHAHVELSELVDTRDEGAWHKQQAKIRYINSLSLCNEEDLNVARSIWCGLCHVLHRLYEYNGIPLDVPALYQFMDQVVGPSETPISIEMLDVLNYIAGVYWYKFHVQRDMEALEQAIRIQREIVYSDSDCDLARKIGYVGDLAASLGRSFEMKGKQADLDEGISLSDWAKYNCEIHRYVSRSKCHLGRFLGFRYVMFSRNPGDLEKALPLLKEAIREEPGADWIRNILAITLFEKYQCGGSLHVLDEAISTLQDVLTWPKLGPQATSLFRLNMLNGFVLKADETGYCQELPGISELAVSVWNASRHEEVHVVPMVYPVGAAFRLLYQYTQNYTFLAEGFRVLSKILETPTPEDIGYYKAAGELSNLNMLKYEYSDCSDYLDEAIKAASNALESVQRFHEALSADVLLTLATAYWKRYEKHRQIGDLTLAKKYSEVAREVNDRKWRETDFELLCGLIKLRTSADCVDLEGIDKAVELFRKSIDLAEGRGPPARIRAFHGLSVGLKSRYEVTGRGSDLEEAKQWANEATQLILEVELWDANIADDLSRIHIMHSTLSSDEALQDLLSALILSSMNVKKISTGHVAKNRYFETLHSIFVEGEKYGQDTSEELKEAAEFGMARYSFDRH